LWQHRTTIDGLQLGEVDEAQLAVELAARRPDRGTWILSRQADRCLNDDLRMRLRLLTSALPGDVGRGLDFIRRLGDASARRPEAHVIDALRLLHHPLHADVAVELIAPSLALLPEVRRTGDIFLPQRWIAAILGGHRSRRAAEEVERFVASLPPDGPVALRSLVLSVADPVLRAATHVS
jgi:aminopeptidase N